MDDPATQALADRVGKSTADNLSSDPIGPTLETLTGADDESDEVIVWTAASLKDAVAQEKAAFHHFAREISSRRDPATVSDHLLKALSGIPLGICIAQNGIAKVCEVLQRYIDNLPETEIAPTGVSGASDDTPGTGVALPTSNATQDGPSVSEMALEHATSKTEKTMQSEGCVTTVVMINNLELKVTAWQGETPDQISENILNALEGLRKAVASEKVKSFAAVSDGRDTLTVIKRDGQILSEPIKERIGSQPLPPNATPITSAPSAQQAASGTSDVFMIKVGKTFKKDKDQIQFECNGFEEAPKYSSKDISALVKIVSGLRKMDGSVLTAADLTDGSKHPVKGKLNWKLSNDGKYTNVMGTEAA